MDLPEEMIRATVYGNQEDSIRLLEAGAKEIKRLRKTQWQPIETAPKDTIILLGTESDPFVDKHMFFIDMGWSHKEGFWSMVHEGTIYPSHWAPITSPITTAPITHYKNCEYYING